MTLTTSSTVSHMMRHSEDELVMQATSWQFPSHDELALDSDAALEEILPLRETAFGTDECQKVLSRRPPSYEVLWRPDAGYPKNPSSFAYTPLDEVQIEGELEPQKTNRPFLALMLPEWVHEKAAEDEAAGTFTCRSLASFASSPTSSTASSPATSPTAPCRVGIGASRPRVFSGVSWADLAESEDEGPIQYDWSIASSASTAASSPAAVCTAGTPKIASLAPMSKPGASQHKLLAAPIETASSPSQSPIAAPILSHDFFVIGDVEQKPVLAKSMRAAGTGANAPQKDDGQALRQAGVRWTELIDSDLDPLDYQWSYVPA